MIILKKFYRLVSHIYSIRDPSFDDYPFMGDPPIKLFIIVVLYVLLLKYGPSYMRNREAFKLKFVMTVYNVFQIVINLGGVVAGIYVCFIKTKYDFVCEPYIRGSDDITQMKRNLAYVYVMSKFWDLFDTVFIILKKKDKQLSILHCYHHLMMASGSYFILKWFTGGPFVALAFLNSFVHGVMYFYYLLSSYKSELRQSIKWKKHITHLQMIQFTLIIISFSLALFSKDCEFSKALSAFMIAQTSLILYLFARFYVKAYLTNNKSVKTS